MNTKKQHSKVWSEDILRIKRRSNNKHENLIPRNLRRLALKLSQESDLKLIRPLVKNWQNKPITNKWFEISTIESLSEDTKYRLGII